MANHESPTASIREIFPDRCAFALGLMRRSPSWPVLVHIVSYAFTESAIRYAVAERAQTRARCAGRAILSAAVALVTRAMRSDDAVVLI